MIGKLFKLPDTKSKPYEKLKWHLISSLPHFWLFPPHFPNQFSSDPIWKLKYGNILETETEEVATIPQDQRIIWKSPVPFKNCHQTTVLTWIWTQTFISVTGRYYNPKPLHSASCSSWIHLLSLEVCRAAIMLDNCPKVIPRCFTVMLHLVQLMCELIPVNLSKNRITSLLTFYTFVVCGESTILTITAAIFYFGHWNMDHK